jgi:hypothetical protein
MRDPQAIITEAIKEALGGRLGEPGKDFDIKVIKVDKDSDIGDAIKAQFEKDIKEHKAKAKASSGCNCGHCGGDVDPLDELMAKITGKDDMKEVLGKIHDHIELGSKIEEVMDQTDSTLFDVLSVVYSMAASVEYAEVAKDRGMSTKQYSNHAEELAQDIMTSWLHHGKVRSLDVDDLLVALLLAGLRMTDTAASVAEDIKSGKNPIADRIKEILKDLA